MMGVVDIELQEHVLTIDGDTQVVNATVFEVVVVGGERSLDTSSSVTAETKENKFRNIGANL